MMQNKQLRVMQIIGNLDIGGAQEVVRTLATYLTEAGSPTVVCTFKDGPLRQEIERQGILVEVLPARRYSVLALPLFVVDMLRIRRELARLVRKHRVNVVQTHLLRALDFLVLSLRFQADLHVFWTVHNYNFALQPDQLPRHLWLLGAKRLAHRLLYLLAVRWAAGFIAVSDEVETAILQQIGSVRDKIAVICNGVDVRRYGRGARARCELGLPEQARLLTVVGTLKEQKGHRFLIEAAAPIVARYPDLHILVVGDGALMDPLKAQAAALGLERHVHFLGSRDDVPSLLAASDYFVLPSLWEGLPMALVEAMASELPIVATEVSGTRQVMVAGETGLLVPPGDAALLREAILGLLAEPRRARAMARAARRRVEQSFSAAKQAEEHLALYRRALNGSGGNAYEPQQRS